MDNVSRPLIALLIGSVAFFAVWMVALKPSSGGSGGSPSGGSTAYQSAIAKAHAAVATSAAASVAHGGTVAAGPTAAPATSPAAQTGTPAGRTNSPAATPAAVTGQGAAKLTTHAAPIASSHPAASATPASRLSTVEQALRTNKVLALLFYNGAAADDRAVRQELAAVPTRQAHVVKLAVPLTELAQYTVVTNQVPVSASPTLVLIDRTQHATTIVGFADRFEIAQRVDDALSVR